MRINIIPKAKNKTVESDCDSTFRALQGLVFKFRRQVNYSNFIEVKTKKQRV